MDNNNNLVSIEKLKNVIKQKNLMKYINDVGYSKVKNKKYFVKTIDNKKVNFGDIRYSDYLTNKDKDKRQRFKLRFYKLFNKFSQNFNKPIFWTFLILW